MFFPRPKYVILGCNVTSCDLVPTFLRRPFPWRVWKPNVVRPLPLVELSNTNVQVTCDLLIHSVFDHSNNKFSRFHFRNELKRPVMDIFGSTLTSPTVSWTMIPNIKSNRLKRPSNNKSNQETSGFDQSTRLTSQHRNYQTSSGKSSDNMPFLLMNCMLKLFIYTKHVSL